jgi:hypothetical protein
MNPLITKIQESENRFEEMTDESLLPRNIQGADKWLAYNTDKHLFENYVYGEPMFDLSKNKVKAFHRSSLISLFKANIERLEKERIKPPYGKEDFEKIEENEPLSVKHLKNAKYALENNLHADFRIGFNQAIDQEITFMRETIKSLENE